VNVQPRLGLCVLIAFTFACSGNVDDADGGQDAQVVLDSGDPADAGQADPDAAAMDAGEEEDSGAVADTGANPDAAMMDSGVIDMGTPDTGPADTGTPDSGPADTGAPDTGTPDTGPADTGAPDTGAPDTGTPDAGAMDSGVALACDVLVVPPQVNAGQVGANGGSPGPDLQCPLGVEVIGVAVRVSDQNTANGAPSAVSFTVACAPVQVGASGATVGPETLPEVGGNGQFGWTPATQSTITRCPPGWIVSGLTANTGPGGNLFLDATVHCSELLPSGATSGVTQSFPVMGSGVGGGSDVTVNCAAGQVVGRMTTRVGAGLDAVSLLCGTPTCAGP